MRFTYSAATKNPSYDWVLNGPAPPFGSAGSLSRPQEVLFEVQLIEVGEEINRNQPGFFHAADIVGQHQQTLIRREGELDGQVSQAALRVVIDLFALIRSCSTEPAAK
jgi:hypothetical protein